MPTMQLEDIKAYWTKKYPDTSIFLYSNDKQLLGKIIGYKKQHEFSADTIGELISKGELFLRNISR